MRSANLSLLSAALLGVAPAVVLGQAAAPGRPRGPMVPVRSPEVQKDGRVTCRVRIDLAEHQRFTAPYLFAAQVTGPPP